jgi:hypothetical protein
LSDPLRLVWDALDAGGYNPHGQPHDFRARCPEHDGDSVDALHVTVATDGRVLLYCFAHGCRVEDIVARLSLRMRDLYPVDLGDSGRRLRNARREDFSETARPPAEVLAALDHLGEPWEVSILMNECPNCEWPHARIVWRSTGEAFVHCERDCEPRMVNQALAERIRDGRRAA